MGASVSAIVKERKRQREKRDHILQMLKADRWMEELEDEGWDLLGVIVFNSLGGGLCFGKRPVVGFLGIYDLGLVLFGVCVVIFIV